MKPCACGCGELIEEKMNYHNHKPMIYKHGHSYRGLWWYEGKPHTTKGKKRPDARLRMLLHNPNKLENVGYAGLHTRMKQKLPKPAKCQNCDKESTELDLANISDLYREDVSDWWYICRGCHMRIDGRISNLHQLLQRK